MGYKLYLDDRREPKTEGWVIARDYRSFVHVITEGGLPELISFDHDLADEHYDYAFEFDDRLIVPPGEVKIDYRNFKEMTGYDCAKWLVNYCFDKNQDIPEFFVHSANPVGAENIQKFLDNAKKEQAKRKKDTNGK